MGLRSTIIALLAVAFTLAITANGQKPIDDRDILHDFVLDVQFSRAPSKGQDDGVLIELGTNAFPGNPFHDLKVIIPGSEFAQGALSPKALAFPAVHAETVKFLKISLVGSTRRSPAYISRIRLRANNKVIFNRQYSGLGHKVGGSGSSPIDLSKQTLESNSLWKHSPEFCLPQSYVTYQVIADVLLYEAMMCQDPASPNIDPHRHVDLCINELRRPLTPTVMGGQVIGKVAKAILNVPFEWTEPVFGGPQTMRLDAQYDVEISDSPRTRVRFKQLLIASSPVKKMFEEKIRNATEQKLRDLALHLEVAGIYNSFNTAANTFQFVPFKNLGQQVKLNYDMSRAGSCF